MIRSTRVDFHEVPVETILEVERELRERRRLRRVSSPNRSEGISGRAATLALANHLEWLRQAGFDEVDCLWKDMRRAIIGGFRHSK
jgi:hypothetical protein